MPGSTDREQLDRSTQGTRERVAFPGIDTPAAGGENLNGQLTILHPDAGNIPQPLPLIEDVGEGFVIQFKNIDNANDVDLGVAGTDEIDGAVIFAVGPGAYVRLVSQIQAAGLANQWRQAPLGA